MNWRERLDARIDRCDGCGCWRWDRLCAVCTGAVDNEVLPDREEAA